MRGVLELDPATLACRSELEPRESGDGFEPWALQVLEIEDGKVVEFSFFLDTETLFPLFGLPLEFDA